MSLSTFITAMPKVEMHVHLEGAIQPETLLALAHKHQVQLPAQTVDGLRQWYTFSDFGHFIEVYTLISACIRTPDDIELIARQFLAGQAAQNIRYSEVTYTPYTHFMQKGLSFEDQLAALNRARSWALAELGVSAGWVMDISRELDAEKGMVTARWAMNNLGNGVLGLGLGGPEAGNPPERFAAVFRAAREAGVPALPHAGEMDGPASIWGALEVLQARRIFHGVRCLEDPALVAELRRRQTPLDICPTSNVCLKVAASIAEHPLPRLLAEGLNVTLNSDDPALFNCTLTGEYQAVAEAFHLEASALERLALSGVRASLLPEADKERLAAEFAVEYEVLRRKHLP